MRRLSTRLFLAALALGLSTQGALAASKEESPEALLKKYFPKLPVSSVKKTDIDGLYEVVSDTNVIYFNPKTGYIIVGNMFSKDGRNLTAETQARISTERIRLLTAADKQKAVKVGNGKHEIIEITDPDCPFCRKMHEYWGRRPDVTRYVFFLPLAMHPDAEKKARYILSAENKELALWEVYSGELDNNKEKLEKKYDDKGLLDFHKSVAAKLHVQSTPAFWVEGTFVNGANVPVIEKLIGKCTTTSGVPLKPGAPAESCEEDKK